MDNFIHNSSVVKDSELGSEIKIYANARVRDCTIGDFVSIGDASSLLKSKLANRIFIQRYNDIIYSEIGKYTCTGRYDVIHCATIGAFCSISWDVWITTIRLCYPHIRFIINYYLAWRRILMHRSRSF